jgi:hypothetical protein
MKSKKVLSTKVIVPVVALGIIAVATLSSVTLASAQGLDSERDTLISKIASKFGLNETEVKETFEEFRFEHSEERHQRMEERLEERLNQAVDNGNLTEDQRFAMLEKHEELEGKFDDLYDLSPEDMREARADIHEEMEAWAQENDIDMEKIGQFERRLHQKGGKFMHRE